MPIEVGLTATITHEVCERDLAPAFGSGDVPLLATPRVIGWCEEATISAIEAHLEPGETSVGMRIRVDHVFPSALGSSVSISASLARVEGRRLTFQVEANTVSDTPIAVGQVVRVIVDRRRFLERVSSL